MTLSFKSSFILIINSLKATYFNCKQIKYFINLCPDPYIILRINEIKKNDIKTLNDEVINENDADSELKN